MESTVRLTPTEPCLTLLLLQGFVLLSMSVLASGQELIAPPRIETLLLDVMSNIMRPSEVYAQYQKLVIRIHRVEDISPSEFY